MLFFFVVAAFLIIFLMTARFRIYIIVSFLSRLLLGETWRHPMQNALHCVWLDRAKILFFWKPCVKSLHRYHNISLFFLNALIKEKFLEIVHINLRVMSNGHLFCPDCLVKCCLLFKYDAAIVLCTTKATRPGLCTFLLSISMEIE